MEFAALLNGKICSSWSRITHAIRTKISTK